MIRIREVRVIDDEGQQLGVMPTAKALALAQEKGLDLVEVAPTAVPPVCRILDYGQYKYELQKREREQKKKQKSQTFKEVRLAVKIDVHDLNTKARRAAVTARTPGSPPMNSPTMSENSRSSPAAT